MTAEEYVSQVRDLVGREEWDQARAFAERRGPRFDEQLSLEQVGALNALLHLAAQARSAAARRSAVAPAPR